MRLHRMLVPARPRATWSVALLLLSFAACGDDDVTAAGRTAVRVRNASTTPMLLVSVTPGPGETVVTASGLAPGQSTAAVAVDALHDFPIVRATVGGVQYTLHPVEGFAPGFNPRKPDGRYVVELRYDAETRLTVTTVDDR